MSDQGTTVEEVQDFILTTAEDLANSALNEELGESESALYKLRIPDRTFIADQLQSEKGGLCLTIDPVFIEGIRSQRVVVEEQRDPGEIIERLHEIGTDAIHQALSVNRDQFVGLILGEARAGRNYFDRFDPSDQTRMF